MDYGYQSPILLARCIRGLPITFDQFVERCQAYMAELMALHRGFAGLHFVRAGDPKRQPALAVDFSNLRKGLMIYGWDHKDPSYYTDLDSANFPTGNTVGDFNLSLSNWEDVESKFSVSVRISPKTYLPTNCTLDFPRLNNSGLLDGPLPVQILEVVLKHWPVRYASYGTRGWNRNFNRAFPDEEIRGCFELGWHTFVDDPSVAEALPSDVPVRRVGQGIVFSLFDSMPDFTNPEHIERGRTVRAALESAGKLKLYSE